MQDMLKDLARRYHKASMELLAFMAMNGVSERFQKQLGLLQLAKSASTIYELIGKQEEYLADAMGQEEGVEEFGAGGSATLTEDKKHVQRAGDRVFLRSLQHVENAIEKIQGSKIYMIESSERARELKLQQRRVSAFNIVDKLNDLREKLEKKRANLKERAQKVTLSPTFQQFRSRSRSPYARSRSPSAKSKSRSRSAKSKSRSRSVEPPGRWTFHGEDEEVFEPVDAAEKASVEKRFPYATRVRLGYNF